MNPELMERFLAKKAKKLGITVEELKAQNAVSSHSEQTVSHPALDAGSISKSNSAANNQGAFANAQDDRPYRPLQPQPEKVEVPSYVFGPAAMKNPSTANAVPLPFTREADVPVNDNRENKFALIGYPLGHSLSKVIHEAGFKSLGIDATYDILETPPDELVDRIKYLKANGYKGFNVTIPLKLPISLFVNEVDNYADLARAVNTVYIEADKTLKAYNTDVIGFKRAIPSDINLSGKKVAILGTGGAAHAACVALTECGVKEIAFFTRNIPNSIELMNYVRRKFPSIDFNVYQIENIRSLEEYSMLVNTTPIGMLGRAGDMSPVEPYALQTLKKDSVVYDVIYNPKKTILIKEAQKLGLRTITGLDMLIFQAVAAQEKWFNPDRSIENSTNIYAEGIKTPDWKDMKIAALEEL